MSFVISFSNTKVIFGVGPAGSLPVKAANVPRPARVQGDAETQLHLHTGMQTIVINQVVIPNLGRFMVI